MSKTERKYSNIDYNTIFNIYGLNGANKTKKNVTRRIIRKKLKRLYGDKKWDELTDYQKEKFIYSDIKDDILSHLEPTKQKKVKERIQKKYDNYREELYKIKDQIKDHNQKEAVRYIQYFDKNNSEEDNRKAHDKLCENLKMYFPGIRIPSYEEWKENPMTIYDYEMCFKIDEFQKHYAGNEESIDKLKNYYYERIPQKSYFSMENGKMRKKSDKELDDYEKLDRHIARVEDLTSYLLNENIKEKTNRVILQVIKDYLGKYHGLDIDVPLIQKCIARVETTEIYEYETIPDNDSSIEQYKTLKECMKMLETLDSFYKVSENKHHLH